MRLYDFIGISNTCVVHENEQNLQKNPKSYFFCILNDWDGPERDLCMGYLHIRYHVFRSGLLHILALVLECTDIFFDCVTKEMQGGVGAQNGRKNAVPVTIKRHTLRCFHGNCWSYSRLSSSSWCSSSCLLLIIWYQVLIKCPQCTQCWVNIQPKTRLLPTFGRLLA